ncbi:MAG: acetyl-CoA carboxylase biotin carboxyl carrier protein [Ignavibacteriota bacterium]
MDLTYLEKVLRLFDESTLTELEIEEEGSQIRLARQKEPAMMQFAPPPQYSYGPPPSAPASAPPASSEGEKSASSAKTHEVKSPIVGTMYRAPSPDADSYVQVGQHVESGATLCIIEAMKLMNEIESDAAGKIIKICVENGQPVEYGQTLFILETA